MDDSLQIITSNLGFSRQRFLDCNLRYVRLVRGVNMLDVLGNGKLEMRYVFGRRIGA